jgi:type VI secretion system protein ImpM
MPERALTRMSSLPSTGTGNGGPATPGPFDAPGWYGKLATLGDFAQRRLPPELVQLGDDWLSRAMSASRQQLGERWLDVYLTAPVIRYAWAPGVVDAAWWFGLLMPSCDNVGRYFPLLIAQRRARPPLDRLALDHLEAWYDHLARAATQTLGEGSTLEHFEQALSEAPPWPTPGTATTLTPDAIAGGMNYPLGARMSLQHWLHALAVEDLHTRFAGCSIWWRQDDATQTASARVVAGLPDAATFAQMLTG